MYQTDLDNSKEYYDVLVNYLFFEYNETVTFNYDDSGSEGSALACLQLLTTDQIFDEIGVYNPELRVNGVTAQRQEAFSEYMKSLLGI